MSSDNSDKHPYTTPSFWLDPSNHFWNSDLYSAKSKAYYQRFVKEQAKLADRKFKQA